MATVTGLTAERMVAIEAQSVVDGEVIGDNLILTRFDESIIDAGNVRGPTGSPGIAAGELADEIEEAFLLNAPVCSIIETLETVAPNALWLTMVGQTVVDGETIYPIFWSKIPAAMKSGSDIIMPNTKGRVSVGLDPADTDFNVIGDTGGAKTHTLSAVEMPVHGHPMPHTHPIDHDHPIVSTTQNPVTPAYQAGNIVQSAGGPYFGISPGAGSGASDLLVNDGLHGHDVDIPNFVGASGSVSTPNTSNAGNGNPHNNLQPYITFLKIIKVA